MKRLGLALVLLALLAALTYWWFLPAQVLKRRSQMILKTLTLAPDSGRTNRQMGIYTLGALLSSTVQLDCNPLTAANGTYDRSEVESAFSWLCDQARQSHFVLEKLHSITLDGDKAEVAFAVDALIALPNSRPIDGHYDVTFCWQLENDAWHLRRANWVTTDP